MAKPTIAEYAHWDRLAGEVGCIVCRKYHGVIDSPVSIHHIDGRTKKGCHMNVIPLCGAHHQTGGSGVAVHTNRARWVKRYGKEEELRVMCCLILGVA